jgi:hypothetical protein
VPAVQRSGVEADPREQGNAQRAETGEETITKGGDRQWGRANLRPPSRSASAIDRLLKNKNPFKNRNNPRPPSPQLVLGKRPGTAPQFCGPKFMDTSAIAVPIPNVRFRHSTIRRRGARRPPPREDPA